MRRKNVRETKLQKEIVDGITLHPKVSHVVRSNAGNIVYKDEKRNKFYSVKLAPKGFPDISGMLKGGRSFFVEVKKSEDEEPTSDQIEWHERIRADGGLVFVGWNVGMVWDWLDSLEI